MTARKHRINNEERKKILSGRRRSLSRRKKELPAELIKPHKHKKQKNIVRRKKNRRTRTTVYQKLNDYIKGMRNEDSIELSFLDIENVLGRKLPTSARKYKAWWANNRSSKATSRHSRAWMDHGYLVTRVNFKKGTVTFSKTRGQKKMTPYTVMLLEAARSLHKEGKVPFSRKELFSRVAKAYPRQFLRPNALNPVIQAMIENSNSAKMVAECWRSTFTRMGRGVYRINQHGLNVDIKKPRSIRIKGKTIHTRVKYYFLAKKNWNLEPGQLKLGRGMPTLSYPLLSEDKGVAVWILASKKLRSRESMRSHFFEAVYLLEKAPVARKILVIEEKTGRTRVKQFESLISEYKKLTRGISIFKYIMGNNPEKDQLVNFK